MSTSPKFFRYLAPYAWLDAVRGYASWSGRGFSSPSPSYVKRACLVRNGIPNGAWVETGTYLGGTTEILARFGGPVFSIEPESKLFAKASERLRHLKNVRVLHGTSEVVLPGLLSGLAGDISFWLDGHYSAGGTYEGTKHTPVVEELDCIAENLGRLNRVCVLVDDIRCFNPSLPDFKTYPPLDFLVDWARKNDLVWHIEHDIFCATR